MTTTRIKYTNNLRCTNTHLRSGSQIITDAPVDNNGKGEAFSPTDLVATALGSCVLTIVAINLEKRNRLVPAMKAEVEKIMQSNPRKIRTLKIKISIFQQLNDKEKQAFEKWAKTCPVALSLDQEINQEYSFQYLDPEN